MISDIVKYLQQFGKDKALQECQNLVLFTMSQTIAFLLAGGNLNEAIRWSRQITQLFPNQPLPYSDLAYLLGLKGEFEEALEFSKKAISFGIDVFEIYQIHADILYGNTNYEEAIVAYRKALSMSPNAAMLHFHLSNCLMRTGNYREALQEHEWRFKAVERYAKFRQRYDKPDWNGEEGTVLVVNEQGLGDAIQYCRYIHLFKQPVILEVQDDLVSLLKQINVPVCGRSIDIKERRSLPRYDYVTFFTSLPFRFDPDLDKIPGKDGYLKPQNPKSISLDGKLKIGICWAGNPNHPLDKHRSCYLKVFNPLARLPGVKLFSLQKGSIIRDWSGDLTIGADMELIDSSDYMQDMNDTANLIDKLDLVITVDTAVAHLAGSMGKPVWMLIASDLHDSRWRDREERTSWYNSMRIFQQKTDWNELIDRVVNKLKEEYEICV